MSTYLPYLAVLGGFVALFGGGEFLVRGAVGISEKLGIPKLLVGLTVVAFATSCPELVVSISSGMKNQADLAVGNVVGSNIANILLILGITAIILPIVIDKMSVRRDLVVMMVASAALSFISVVFGYIDTLLGLLLFASLIIYIIIAYRSDKKSDTDADDEAVHGIKSLPIAIAVVAGGLGLLVVGAQWLIFGASTIARTFGVSEAVIGLTVVAVGTSLPELATSMISAIRGHSDIAVGNVVGSNIFNVLCILGLTATVLPKHKDMYIDPTMIQFDIPFMLIASGVAAVILAYRGKIDRWIGVGFVVTYIAYVAFKYTMGSF